MESTPTLNSLPLRPGDFCTLTEALDYAAMGETGINFYSSGIEPHTVVPYAILRQQARAIARRLLGLNLTRGAKVSIVADTQPDFQRFFFACQYAGLTPVPLPAVVQLGGRKSYLGQLRRLLIASKTSIAVAPKTFIRFLFGAADEIDLTFIGTPEDVAELPEKNMSLFPLEPNEVAYIQFTSGSTRFPKGVVISQEAVMRNIADMIQTGVKVRAGDRAVSWLPFYHDMGLVGLVLAPLASQLSVDYISPRDFAMRPRIWLSLMANQRASISFGPSMGYELCAQRLGNNGNGNKFDLGAWRVAGVGAETIRPAALKKFAELLAPGGFDQKAFLACYGLAECSLAVSFTPLWQGIEEDWVDGNHLSEHGKAIAIDRSAGNVAHQCRSFVNCGIPLPDYDIEIRDKKGQVVPERQCGTIFVRGPSLMSGYFGDPQETGKVLSSDGWLNTGDLGYRVGDSIVVTGREKDQIVLYGRNIYPQDLEFLAENEPQVRAGDAAAFSAPQINGAESSVMLIQCCETDSAKRKNLVKRLRGRIARELGIECSIKLVPRNSLPRTTSGKLSRSKAREYYLKSARMEIKDRPLI